MKINIPQKWTECSLNDLGRWGSGGTPKKSESRFYENGTIPWLVIGDLNDSIVKSSFTLITEEALKESSAKLVPPGTLFFAMYGSVGKTGVAGMACATNQAIAFCLPCPGIEPRYLFRKLQWVRPQLIAKAKGGTQQNISQEILRAQRVPLAPIEQQRRIAEKLDTTLARVDTLNDRLARITPLLKRFRQSVLAAATSGRLTEDWRQNKDISTFSWKAITEFREQILPDLPNSWKWVEFSEVASVQSDLRDPSEYQNEIHLAPNHIEPWSGKISGCQTIADDAVKSPKHWFNAGQIVYSKIRPNLCKVAIPNFSGLCSADMYPISTKLNDSYLLLWMLGERFTSWASNAESRTVLPKINTKELGKIPVPVTSAEEQTEIVRRVEILFAFADRLEARLQSAQTAAERLTPALLAKAFRGELVPQDPSDEPATELLRRLREARAADTASKPKRGRAAKAPTVSE